MTLVYNVHRWADYWKTFALFFLERIRYCRGLHTVIVQFVILLWRGFNHVKILDWNVNKSASRIYINAPKVE
jgi:hypothetical protein